MTNELKVTVVESTTRYEYATSNESFSENGHFDHRPERDSFGFSFYTYAGWVKITRELEKPSREAAIAWAEKYIGNEVTAFFGSYKLREVTHTVTVTEGQGIYEKVERDAIVEFHTVQRTTFEQEQLHIQYEADRNDAHAVRMADFEQREMEREAEAKAAEAKATENLVAEETEEVTTESAKNWFQKLFV